METTTTLRDFAIVGWIVDGTDWTSFYITSSSSIGKVIIILLEAYRRPHSHTRIDSHANEFPMQIKRKCFFFRRRILFKWHTRDILLLKPGAVHSAWSRHFLFCSINLRETEMCEREKWANCTFLPSWCTTLAWFQVLNCYFNMTTSHVLHHLHHTPSTHPDSWQWMRAVERLWDICTTCARSVPVRKMEEKKS